MFAFKIYSSCDHKVVFLFCLFRSFSQKLPCAFRVNVHSRVLVALFHRQTQFPIISYLSKFNEDLIISIVSRVSSLLQPRTIPDLTYMYKSFLPVSRSRIFNKYKETEVLHLHNFSLEYIPHLEWQFTILLLVLSIIKFPVSRVRPRVMSVMSALSASISGGIMFPAVIPPSFTRAWRRSMSMSSVSASAPATRLSLFFYLYLCSLVQFTLLWFNTCQV